MDVVDVFEASILQHGKVNINQGEFRRILLSDYPYYYDYPKNHKMMILNKFVNNVNTFYKFVESKNPKKLIAK